MTPILPTRLPALLETAIQRVKLAARDAAERTVESLGLSTLAASNAFQRDVMLNAQFELNRKGAIFALTFDETLDKQIRQESGLRSPTASPLGPDSWEALSLVDDHELEVKVSAERFGLEISLACEWELRELEAYVGSLLGHARAERERNPLRPELVGIAMIRAIEAVVDRADSRKVLTAEFGRSLAGLLRTTYADIVGDMRKSGIQPVGMMVRNAEDRSENSRYGGLDSSRGRVDDSHGGDPGPSSRGGDSRFGGRRGMDSRAGPASRSGIPPRRSGGHGTPLGQVDPGMMSLIRRLTSSDTMRAASSEHGGWDGETSGHGGGLPLPNLIREHREELRQAASGSLDHMVIDVIGSLFDQILSDPKVPPQMARQIARLQLPVLRAALGDPSFFSSRRHPVRRFVNRIASLGAGFDDFSAEGAQRFLGKVRELVQEVVEGDFDQLETYENKLAKLEAFVAEQASQELQADGDAGSLLAQKEDELRLRHLYAQQLQGELKDMTAPEFLREFISQVWSQVLLQAADRHGSNSARLKELRMAGRELFMSVQPKTSPAQRKAFLTGLPKLMQELNEGMSLIHWPESSRRHFFGQLLPAHADALKAQPLRPLDFNMMAKRIDNVLERDLPSKASLPAASLPVLDDEIIVPRFSAEEAARVGLIDEQTFDWDGKVDIDLSAEPPIRDEDTRVTGLPAPSEPAEPTSGKSLADHVQVGFSYQMHVDGGWQKVRLAHVSAGRAFFVFTRGTRHQRTISLTHRMMVRLCETNRLRTVENAYLLERATARARRQLSSLGASAASH